MPSDKDFYKKKNILDATYQKYLNYFNILAISLITSLFTVFWAYFTKTVTFELMISSIVSIISLFGMSLTVAYLKMNDVLELIKKV
jgi:VIT1/CCC1 family predicted Fe2+/Mn2+ transporter